MACAFVVDDCKKWMVCQNEGCGRRVPVRDGNTNGRDYRASCRGASQLFIARLEECPHLLEATGESEIVHCETCHGNVRIKYAVSGCALHGRCLPTYRGHEPTAARPCNTCQQNPNFVSRVPIRPNFRRVP